MDLPHPSPQWSVADFIHRVATWNLTGDEMTLWERAIQIGSLFS